MYDLVFDPPRDQEDEEREFTSDMMSGVTSHYWELFFVAPLMDDDDEDDPAR